jgi:hypothetical protein
VQQSCVALVLFFGSTVPLRQIDLKRPLGIAEVVSLSRLSTKIPMLQILTEISFTGIWRPFYLGDMRKCFLLLPPYHRPFLIILAYQLEKHKYMGIIIIIQQLIFFIYFKYIGRRPVPDFKRMRLPI